MAIQEPHHGPSQAWLHSRGIHASPEQLIETLWKAVAALPKAPMSVPDEELSASELEALAAVGFETHPKLSEGEVDPVAETAAALASLVESSLTVKQAARQLAVDDSRVRQRLTRDRTLYGFLWQGEWRIPTFQFLESGEPLSNLGPVVQALPEGLHPVAAAYWFTHPHPDLEADVVGKAVSPRDWLALGLDVEVLAHIAHHLA